MAKRRLPALDPEDQALWDALKREITPLCDSNAQAVASGTAKARAGKGAGEEGLSGAGLSGAGKGSASKGPTNKAAKAATAPKQPARRQQAASPDDLIWQAPGQFANPDPLAKPGQSAGSGQFASLMGQSLGGGAPSGAPLSSGSTLTPGAVPTRRHPNDLRDGGSVGLDRAKAERLRRGKMPIEGTLDLHGLTQDQAQARLEQFILAAAAAGKRNLLIITGKGLSSGGRGVLRARVPEWLGQGALGRYVLAFSYAQKRDGEQGALYVLLRRRHG